MRTKRPLYREILEESFRVAIRNWRLWPLGFFAAMLLSGSPYDILFRSWSTVVEGPAVSYDNGMVSRIADAVAKIHSFGIGRIGWGAPVMILLLLVVLAAIAWISVVSQGALLSAVTVLEERKRPDLHRAFRDGVRDFWPLLWVNVIMRAAVVAASVILAILLIPASRYGGGPLYAAVVVAFLVFLPVAYFAINVAFFAEMAIVRHKRRLGAALSEAWRLVTRHWLLVLETSSLVLLIDAAVAVATTFSCAAISVPFFVLFLGALAVNSMVAYWTVMAIYLLLLAAAILVVASATVTFHYAVWALLAERIRKDDATPKLLRLWQAIAARVGRK